MGTPLSKPVEEWTSEDVAIIVGTTGGKYEAYAEAIQEEGVCGLVLSNEKELEETLTDLKITSKLHRRILRKKWAVYSGLKLAEEEEEKSPPTARGKSRKRSAAGSCQAVSKRPRDQKFFQIIAKTNEDLHKEIKSKLMNKRAEEIFDLLFEHGALSRRDLAKLLGISDTGPLVSKALAQLRDLGYAENVRRVDGQSGRRIMKVRLTDQAYVNPDDRQTLEDDSSVALLMEIGREEVTTEDLKELLLENRKGPTFITKENEEHHNEIKSTLMNDRGRQIFDLLVQYGEVSRSNLARLIGISNTGEAFSKGLKQLRDLGYAENFRAEDGAKKVRLTPLSFADGRDKGDSHRLPTHAGQVNGFL